MLVALFLYLLIGLVAASSPNGSNLRGRALTVLIWPYILIFDGTVWIRWLTHFSGVEVVIEETTALNGSIVQTVRQVDGHEYTRVKAGSVRP